ncbi:MAG: DUF3592 domain-containing protein [Syntrophorhabdaceae bacterium]|nr:DUF3592 domain-containing protein [Syntrophorhabdaceae bacterium]
MAGVLVVGLLFIGVPVVVLIVAIRLLRKNQAGSRRIRSIPPGWRAIEGRVIGNKTEVAARTHPEDFDFYYPMILFEYTVEGRRYTGAQGVDRAYGDEYRVKKILAEYPVGNPIVVHYDPSKPEDARLRMRS